MAYTEQPESPIEKKIRLIYNDWKLQKEEVLNILGYDKNFILKQQYPITVFFKNKKPKDYIVDFYQPDTKTCIELDGHTYHSSRDELKRDKSKDRDLLRSGYHTIRFTSDEVFESPIKCLSDIYQVYCSRAVINETNIIDEVGDIF